MEGDAMKDRVFKKDRSGLANEVFHFRLDRSIQNSDEDIVWRLIEESESKGVGLREFIVDRVLIAEGIQPHKGDRKSIVSQLRREVQKLGLMIQQFQSIQFIGVQPQIGQLDNTPKEVLENITSMLDNMTEYGDE